MPLRSAAMNRRNIAMRPLYTASAHLTVCTESLFGSRRRAEMVSRRCAQDFEQRTGSMRLQMTFCSRDEPVSPPQTVFRRPVDDARTPRNAVRGPSKTFRRVVTLFRRPLQHSGSSLRPESPWDQMARKMAARSCQCHRHLATARVGYWPPQHRLLSMRR